MKWARNAFTKHSIGQAWRPIQDWVLELSSHWFAYCFIDFIELLLFFVSAVKPVEFEWHYCHFFRKRRWDKCDKRSWGWATLTIRKMNESGSWRVLNARGRAQDRRRCQYQSEGLLRGAVAGPTHTSLPAETVLPNCSGSPSKRELVAGIPATLSSGEMSVLFPRSE